jgi:methionyl-tRNA synthetase
MSDESYYVTTPIYYVSGDPHVGTAYTTIAADVAARFQRMKGKDVFFLTGSDEHGQKINKAAEEKGMTPQELADSLVPKFKELWDHLDITHDKFIRTTDPEHEKTVQAFFRELNEQGDIYKGTYEGWYCTHCESYIQSADEDDNLCDDCGRPGEYLEEDNYFFRLSEYEDYLKQLFEERPEFVQPESRRNEMLSRIEDGLEDVSVSRSSFDWGVPLPNDEEHVIWVWFDALINYVSALGYPDNEEAMDQYWPTVTHLVGKEILWFHSIVWPAMLKAVGLSPPRRIYAHGWWTMNAEKLSKSKGNVIYPRDITEEFGVDPLRYFMLREIPFGQDGDFSNQSFINRYNHDLGNDFGNLLYRVESMLESYRDGVIPEPGEPTDVDQELRDAFETATEKLDRHLEELTFHRALESIWEAIQFTNKYAERTEPWELAKDDDRSERLDTVLYHLLEALRISSVLLRPFLPNKTRQLRSELGLDPDADLSFPDDAEFGQLPHGHSIEKGDPLFPRYEDD